MCSHTGLYSLLLLFGSIFFRPTKLFVFRCRLLLFFGVGGALVVFSSWHLGFFVAAFLGPFLGFWPLFFLWAQLWFGGRWAAYHSPPHAHTFLGVLMMANGERVDLGTWLQEVILRDYKRSSCYAAARRCGSAPEFFTTFFFLLFSPVFSDQMQTAANCKLTQLMQTAWSRGKHSTLFYRTSLGLFLCIHQKNIYFSFFWYLLRFWPLMPAVWLAKRITFLTTMTGK